MRRPSPLVGPRRYPIRRGPATHEWSLTLTDRQDKVRRLEDAAAILAAGVLRVCAAGQSADKSETKNRETERSGNDNLKRPKGSGATPAIR